MSNALWGNTFKKTLKSWIEAYSKEKGTAIDEWMKNKLQEQLGEGVDNTYTELTEGIYSYEQNKSDIQRAYEKGSSKEEWMAEKLQDATSGLIQNERIEVFSTIQEGLAENLGIVLEQQEDTTSQQEIYTLKDNMLAKMTGDLASARSMQVLGEDDFTEVEYEDDEYSEYVERSLQDNRESDLKKLASGTLVTLVKTNKI